MAAAVSLLPLLSLLLLLAASAAGLRVTRQPVMAVHYNVTLAPFFYSSNASLHQMSGSVSIRTVALQDTNYLNWHIGSAVRQLDDFWLQDAEGKNLTIYMWATNLPEQKLQWHERVGVNNPIFVRVPKFTTPLRAVQYLDADNKTKFAATSLGLRTYDFLPCLLDEPVAVTMDVSIIRRSDFSAVMNSESVANTTEENVTLWWPELDASETSGFSWIRETFATTEAMPVSRFQFVVSQLPQVASRTDSQGRIHRFWSSPPTAPMLSDIADDTVQVQQWLEERLGAVNYTKFDYFLMQSESSSPYRAQAGYGVAVIGCNKKFTQSNPQLMLEVSLYELSKQLSRVQLYDFDAAAKVLGYAAVTSVHPEWRTDAFMLNDFRKRWWPRINCRMRYAPRCQTFELEAQLLQMRYVAGARMFDKLIAGYYRGLTNKPLKLIDLDEMRDSKRLVDWQDGIPVVTCSVADNQLVLEQQSLYEDDEMSNSTWSLPITMVTSDNTTTSRWNGTEQWDNVQWLTESQQSFASFNATKPPSWYLLNLRGAGLYRVNYNAENWAALGRLLMENHELLHPLERAAIIEDSFELARLEMLEYSVPADIIKYLGRERHHLPVLRAAEALIPLVMRQPWAILGSVVCEVVRQSQAVLGIGSAAFSSPGTLMPRPPTDGELPPLNVLQRLYMNMTSFIGVDMVTSTPETSSWRYKALVLSYLKLLPLERGCVQLTG